MISTKDSVIVRLVTDNTTDRGRIAAALLDHDDLILSDDSFENNPACGHGPGEPTVVVIAAADDAPPALDVISSTGRAGGIRALLVVHQVADAIVERALRAGYFGVLTFDEVATRLGDAVREISRGGVSFPPEITRRIIFDRQGLRLRPPHQ